MKRTKIVNAGLIFIGFAYLCVLVKIVLLKYGFTTDAGSLNLIPFAFMGLFRGGQFSDVALKNVFGNIAIFIPLGIYLSMICKKKMWLALPLCGGVSLFFELIQLFTGCGAADVNDLLLNMFGGFLGFLLYKLILMRLDQKMQMRLATTVFLILFGIGGFVSLYQYAPNVLPAQTVIENKEMLQGVERESYNLSATCSEISDETIRIKKDSVTPESTKFDGEVKEEYSIKKDALILVEYRKFQLSPNGNIQKTTIQYKKEDITKIQQLLREQEGMFADLWIDEKSRCQNIILTCFLK